MIGRKDKGPVCPLMKGPCVKADCMFWVHVLGTNPQTGVAVDQFDCSIRWLPILLLENAKQTRGAQSAVESMRNEVVQRQDVLNTAVGLSQRPRTPQIEN